MKTILPTESAVAVIVPDDITEELTTFRVNVRAAMEKKRMNMTQLSVATGMKNSTLSDVLNVNPGCTFSTAKRIAAALETPLWKLLKPKKSR